MAKYRQVHITFWQDPFIEDLTALQRYFYLYLMTNSKTTQCGCYEISNKLIRYETGLKNEQINEYTKFLEKNNKIKYNPENNEFLIVNWLKHNSFKSPKVKSCILKELEMIKTVEYVDFIDSVVKELKTINRLSIEYIKSIDTSPQQEQEQEQEQEEEQEQEQEEEQEQEQEQEEEQEVISDSIRIYKGYEDNLKKGNKKTAIKYIDRLFKKYTFEQIESCMINYHESIRNKQGGEITDKTYITEPQNFFSPTKEKFLMYMGGENE